MTDNEIIRDLQEEIHLAEYVDRGYSEHASLETLKGCLDLINRQKAEIERLKSRRNFLEIEYKNQSNLFWERVEGAKSEAIKEFAEKLKQQAFSCDVSFGFGKEHYTKAVAVLDIEKYVEEMTEGENG